MLIGAALVFGLTFRSLRIREGWSASKPQLYVTAVALLWTLVTTATSTNRLLSLWSAVYVTACALFFVGSCVAVRDQTWTALYVMLAPAIANAIALALQQFRLWDFYRLDEPSTRSALLGNSNDVGAFILAPAVVASALCVVTPVRRMLHLVIAAVLVAAILASGSITATVSYAVAILFTSAQKSWKRTLATAVAVALISMAAVTLNRSLRERVALMRTTIEKRDYNALSSYRLTAFAAAVQMFAKHPLTGVGPGCYAWHYFDEKIAAEAHHQKLRESGDRLHNYREAHSDYLQILAVSGLPGFAILAGSLFFLGSISFRNREADHMDLQAVFSRTASLSLAAGIAVLMTAGFPLELSAPTISILYSVALCFAWRPHDGA